ncbi:MAG: hypothetical protein JW882_05860 [Deltaproteobacteria bacterium]|nr:hypothetical protein [Deltaproteobacteria bacterium]
MKVVSEPAGRMQSLVEHMLLLGKLSVETMKQHMLRDTDLTIEDRSLKFAVGFGLIFSEASRREVHMRIPSASSQYTLFWDELDEMDDNSRQLEDRLLAMVESAKFEDLDDTILKSIRLRIRSLPTDLGALPPFQSPADFTDSKDRSSTLKKISRPKLKSGDSGLGQVQSEQLMAPKESQAEVYGNIAVLNAQLISRQLKDILAHIFTVMEPNSGLEGIDFRDDETTNGKDVIVHLSFHTTTMVAEIKLMSFFNDAFNAVVNNTEDQISIICHIWEHMLVAIFVITRMARYTRGKVARGIAHDEIKFRKRMIKETTIWATQRMKDLAKEFPVEPPHIDEDPFFGPLIKTTMQEMMEQRDSLQNAASNQKQLLDEGIQFRDEESNVQFVSFREYLRFFSDDKDDPSWDTRKQELGASGDKVKNGTPKEEEGEGRTAVKTLVVPFVRHLEFLGYQLEDVRVRGPGMATYDLIHRTRSPISLYSLNFGNISFIILKCYLNFDKSEIVAKYNDVLMALNEVNRSSRTTCYISEECGIELQTCFSSRYFNKADFNYTFQGFYRNTVEARQRIGETLQKS